MNRQQLDKLIQQYYQIQTQSNECLNNLLIDVANLPQNQNSISQLQSNSQIASQLRTIHSSEEQKQKFQFIQNFKKKKQQLKNSADKLREKFEQKNKTIQALQKEKFNLKKQIEQKQKEIEKYRRQQLQKQLEIELLKRQQLQKQNALNNKMQKYDQLIDTQNYISGLKNNNIDQIQRIQKLCNKFNWKQQIQQLNNIKLNSHSYMDVSNKLDNIKKLQFKKQNIKQGLIKLFQFHEFNIEVLANIGDVKYLQQKNSQLKQKLNKFQKQNKQLHQQKTNLENRIALCSENALSLEIYKTKFQQLVQILHNNDINEIKKVEQIHNKLNIKLSNQAIGKIASELFKRQIELEFAKKISDKLIEYQNQYRNEMQKYKQQTAVQLENKKQRQLGQTYAKINQIIQRFMQTLRIVRRLIFQKLLKKKIEEKNFPVLQIKNQKIMKSVQDYCKRYETELQKRFEQYTEYNGEKIYKIVSRKIVQ